LEFETGFADLRQRIHEGRAGLREFLAESECNELMPVLDEYPFRVTEYYAELGRRAFHRGSEAVMRQFLPDRREAEDKEGFVKDPFAEENSPVQGLVHRFPDRALVVASSGCAVNCRHCTRKNTVKKLFPGTGRAYFNPILAYLESSREIREVLVSGGDPLMMDPELLDWLLASLSRIQNIEVLRIGTRLPVVLPGAVDAGMVQLLASHRPLWINTQFNHPAEITCESLAACEKLLRAGIPVSNQSVLLKGINDDAETMIALCNGLQRQMIRPYYVFLCDPVRGTAHFDVPLSRARAIATEVRDSVGGLSMPRFVRDVPGARHKVSVLEG
jgi:lysine 2,3-aminomutase